MRYRRIASALSLSALASLVFAVAARATPVQITTASKVPFGTYLTDSAGRTVYMFTADMHGMSMCSGPCTKPWPAVTTTGTPTAGSGVEASALGAIANGSAQQVTYHGHPLYYFIRDKPAGKGIQPDGKVLAGSGMQ
jgi:predicted lipoprotein with Yx(FWY)xxD motif